MSEAEKEQRDAQRAALMSAVKEDELCEAEHLLQSGISPNFRIDGIPPIYTAIANQSPDMVRLLSHYGADMEMKKSPEEISPLYYAAVSWGNLRTTEEVLIQGASLESRNGEHGRTVKQDVLSKTIPANGMMPLLKHYEQIPSINLVALPSREAIDRPNKHGYNYADHPKFWEKLTQVNEALQARGEPPYDAEWMMRDEKCKNLRYALQCVRSHTSSAPILEGALKARDALGEPLRFDELIEVNGQPTEFLELVVRRDATSALFQREVMHDFSRQQLSQLHEAVQSIKEVEIPNYHALSSSMTHRDRLQSQAAGGGRLR